jgi:putative transcriptional regulator
MKIELRVTLDELLKENNNMTQKQLIELIIEKTGNDKIRPASISELYNNQRKSLNIKLIETIAGVLEITDVSKLIKLEVKDSD